MDIKLIFKNRIIKNTSSLFVFHVAKILFPFITLPYLTRVLTTNSYGVVAYVKTIMSYMQIIVDFGFILSATKDVIRSKNNSEYLSVIIGDTLLARVLLGIIAFGILLIATLNLPILYEHPLYVFLSFLSVFASIFLMDFLFRGLEIMHIITIRFIVMKLISTIMTFIFVRNDKDILLIPAFELLGSLFAIVLVWSEIKKRQIKIHFSGLSRPLIMIKESFVYFLSSVASTSFNALSTIIIGAQLTTTEVAYWGVCMQVIGSIQACYTPISDGIFPIMIQSKNFKLIKRTLTILMPFVILLCLLCYFFSDFGMTLLGGAEYLPAASIFRLLIPCIFWGFLSLILGWPSLGAIDKAKETTISIVLSICFQIAILIILIFKNQFTLINIAIVRTTTDFILFAVRGFFCLKYRKLFNYI